MESRKLATLISSLISHLLLLLLSISPISQNPNFNSNIFHLIRHFLSSQEIASSLSLPQFSRKRKRTHFSLLDSEPTQESGFIELGNRVGGSDRVAPSPDSFKLVFKMRSSTFEWLVGLLEPLLDCRDPIGSPLSLSAELRLGIGLFRLATGLTYAEIADRFGVNESVTRFCSKQLCRVLCTNFRFWVSFPSPGELEFVSKGFEKLTGLPNCCGVIDCSRFKLDNPKSDSHFPQKDNAVAVQIVADSNSRILSIAAGFRGEKGEAEILKSTTLYKDIEAGKLGLNRYLIGGKRYPLLPWLIVPFDNPTPGSCEEKFNQANGLIRVSTFRTVASLKSWGVLSKPIHEDYKTAVAFIGACSILHNGLLLREDDSALVELGDDFCSFDDDDKNTKNAEIELNWSESNASDLRYELARTLIRQF